MSKSKFLNKWLIMFGTLFGVGWKDIENVWESCREAVKKERVENRERGDEHERAP